MSKKSVIVIGSGVAGLSAACYLAKAGFAVTILEKNKEIGGRGRQFTAEGFTFDMGPSWYWMPDVFEKFFSDFGKKISDYYELKRLDPSYRVVFGKNDFMDIPADFNALIELFETTEKGSGKSLVKFMEQAEKKYSIATKEMMNMPGISIREFANARVLKGLLNMDVLENMKTHVAKHFKNERLQRIMEFPVLFLGAKPEKTPALYSLMNYADAKLGTWYPQGGMHKISEAMNNLALALGVSIETDYEVLKLEVSEQNKVSSVATTKGEFHADTVVAAADYNHVEQNLLPEKFRTYTPTYWDKRQLSPSCILFYIGLNKKMDHLLHHTLFFDVPFEQHAKEIYDTPSWPSNPLFYVSATSKTDASVAPKGCENLFILIPVAAGLEGDNEQLIKHYFDLLVQRLKITIGEDITEHILFKKSYTIKDFKSDYHSFKGNAYGLANTLMQTAILKPKMRSKKVSNLYFAGQLTVPGPGLPPSIISGEIVAKQIIKNK